MPARNQFKISKRRPKDTSVKDSTHSDQASRAAARRLIPPRLLP
jgi:hypothetical protein